MSLFHGGSVAYTKSGEIITHPNWLSIERSLAGSRNTMWYTLLTTLPAMETYILPCLLTACIVISIVNIVRTSIASHCENRPFEIHLCAFSVASCLTVTSAGIMRLPRYFTLGSGFPPALPYLASLQHWFWITSVWLLVACLSNRALNSRPPPRPDPNAALSMTSAGFFHQSLSRPTPPAGMTSSAVFLVTMAISAPRLWQYHPLVIQYPYLVNTSTKAWIQLGPEPPSPTLSWLYHITGLVMPTFSLMILCIIICFHSRRWYDLLKANIKLNASQAANQVDMQIDFSSVIPVPHDLGRAHLSTNHFSLILLVVTLPLCTPLPLLHMSSTAAGPDASRDLHRSAPFMAMHTGLTLLFYLGLLFAQLCILVGLSHVRSDSRTLTRATTANTTTTQVTSAPDGTATCASWPQWTTRRRESSGSQLQRRGPSCLPLQYTSVYNMDSMVAYE